MFLKSLLINDGIITGTGVTKLGREAVITVDYTRTPASTDISVTALEGTDFNDAMIDAEVRWVTRETETLASKLEAKLSSAGQDEAVIAEAVAFALSGRHTPFDELLAHYGIAESTLDGQALSP